MLGAAESCPSLGVRARPGPSAVLSGRWNLAEHHCCLMDDLVQNILVPSDRKPKSHYLRKPNHCGWVCSDWLDMSLSWHRTGWPPSQTTETQSRGDVDSKTTGLFLEEGGREAAEVNSHYPTQWPKERAKSSLLRKRFCGHQEPRETFFSSRSTDSQREMLRNDQ